MPLARFDFLSTCFSASLNLHQECHVGHNNDVDDQVGGKMGEVGGRLGGKFGGKAGKKLW